MYNLYSYDTREIFQYCFRFKQNEFFSPGKSVNYFLPITRGMKDPEKKRERERSLGECTRNDDRIIPRQYQPAWEAIFFLPFFVLREQGIFPRATISPLSSSFFSIKKGKWQEILRAFYGIRAVCRKCYFIDMS